MMNDSTFTDCALTILAKCDELAELEGGHGVEPGWYQENQGVLEVKRRTDGFYASVEHADQCSCCPVSWLLHTGAHGNETAALVRLGILLQEQIDKARDAAAAVAEVGELADALVAEDAA